MKKPQEKYDVVIVGGGIIGASTLYTLAKYTDVSSVALIEKRKQIGHGVSHRSWNSQTLHFGDIETNYTREKSEKVRDEAALLAGYLQSHENERLYQPIHKMVLAVGKKEVSELEERYENIKDIFPNLQKLERDGIQKIEPKLVAGRKKDTPILALYNPYGHTVDYGKTAQSFVQEALKSNNTEIDLYMNSKVSNLTRDAEGNYLVSTDTDTIQAKSVLFAVGAASLRFAHSLGYKKNWILLPVAGNFICAPKQVNGKVYMMQLEGIPFAAIHADPAVDNLNETQFGPVVKILPMLERSDYSSVADFFKLAHPRWDAFKALLSIGLKPVYIQYLLKQVLYDIPYLGRWAFLHEARKVIPNIKYNELEEKKRRGGIRPQIVDTKESTLQFGEAKIVGDDIIFDITPSPGASVSLANAFKNTKHIIEFLDDGKEFAEDKFKADHAYQPNKNRN
ncbi:MAG: FAD-dependent oxidoreductase [Candidatus Paceibacterota bacterium]